MVSLDTTLEYTPRDFPGHKELWETLESMERPTIQLCCLLPPKGIPISPRSTNSCGRAPTYDVMVSYLRHNEYLSQGATRATLTDANPSEKKSPAADMRHSYNQVCITIRHFLDAVLKSDEGARAALSQLSTRAASSAALKLRYRAPRE